MLRKGITLIEVIIVIVIVSILLALVLPVFRTARSAAKYTSSLERCHQLGLALSMYRDEYQGADSGTLEQMGLPRLTSLFYGYMRHQPLPHFSEIPMEMWKSPCGWNPQFAEKEAIFHYQYFPEMGGEKFEADVRRLGERYPAFVDVHCDDHSIPIANQFVAHRGIGVLLDGTLVNQTIQGDMNSPAWWSTKLIGGNK